VAPPETLIGGGRGAKMTSQLMTL